MTRQLICAVAIAAAASLASAHGTGASTHRFDAARVEATAFGQEGDPQRVTRTVRVDMSDAMRFEPPAISVRQGETVRFVVRNKGGVLHEMVLGTADELAKHAEMMRKFPGMVHDEPSIAHVEPGRRGEIVWQFTKPGQYRFACLVPGHYEAGMVGDITVR